MNNANPTRTQDWAALVRAVAGPEKPVVVYPFRHPKVERPRAPGKPYPGTGGK